MDLSRGSRARESESRVRESGNEVCWRELIWCVCAVGERKRDWKE